MMLFVQLLLAHLLGDFILQPGRWVIGKEERKYASPFLYLHTALHGLLAFLIVGKPDFWPYALILALLHGGIDLSKLMFQNERNRRSWFLFDQLLHLVVLCAIAMCYEETEWNLKPDDSLLVLLTGVVLLTQPASLLIKVIISAWTPEPKNGDESLSNAGNYIGILERLFIFGFILAGHFEAIGFLLGAKSIFRFGDLTRSNDRKLTEYVLIGTLLSFGIAILTGFAVKELMILTAEAVFY